MAVLKRDTRQAREVSGFVRRCATSLETVYGVLSVESSDPRFAFNQGVRYVLRMLAVLVAGERMPSSRALYGPVRQASEAVFTAFTGSDRESDYESACKKLADETGLGIFSDSWQSMPGSLKAVAKEMLRPLNDAPIGPIYFETMPLNWLGSAYQAMLALRPARSGDGLKASYQRRKDDGVYFTPDYLVEYIVRSVLRDHVDNALNGLDPHLPLDRLLDTTVLDPSMGGGDFLCAVVDYMAESAGSDDCRAGLAAQCVYGVDIDPLAVEVSRFCVWGASKFADGIGDALKSHLVCGDAINGLDWRKTFPEVFGKGGFDALVGNPPYIATKNRALSNTRGQSDSYLLFLKEALCGGLVRPNGMLSMVLPDPMLVRGNAAEARRLLVENWTIVSLMHLPGAFAEAYVANIIPVCKNRPLGSPTFTASRIETAPDRYSLALRPVQTAKELARPVRLETVLAQERCELLYMLEGGRFGDIVRRIHGENAALSNFEPPFAPLRYLNVKAVYRGEEVGKSAIAAESGDYPMLLGGQSIRPYEIVWEGRWINRSEIVKPIERYASAKIIIQKSSARVIAALDDLSNGHKGYVFPQSVYGVELGKPGMSGYYLLCLLNSQVINEYVRRTVTGYKFVHPQLEVEDIRSLPIRVIEFVSPENERDELVKRGLEILENEWQSGGQFALTGNFVGECLSSSPDRADVVHDILSHLGKRSSELTVQNRRNPSAEITSRLDFTRGAIESIVWRLYASDPFQMALPM